MRSTVENIILITSSAIFYERVDHSELKLFEFIIISVVLIQKMMREVQKEQIEESSAQWSNIVYKLQTMTGRSSLKLIKLFKFPLKQQQSKFGNKEKIDSLVDVTEFKVQYKSKIVNKVIPLEDVIFFCGHVNIKKYHSQPNKIFTFLICKINLGKIGKFNDINNDRVDSFFIPPQTANEPYHFNFLLNHQSQYQVRYEASFVVGDDHEIRNKQTVCSICERNLATIYCRDEKMHFCDVCSNNHHIQLKLAYQNEYKRKNNLLNSQLNNKKQPIQIPQIPPHQLQNLNRINSLPLCQSHSIKNEYYCLKCQKYVCNICIQKGTHNQNPQHVIKHIDYLYQEKQQANNTISIRLKDKLQKLIDVIEEISNSITENYQYVKKQLTTQFQMALKRLEDVYFNKISKVYSDQIELNMLYQKIEWTRAFILHQQKYLKPIHYFKLQSRFEQQISNTKIGGFEESFATKPDIDCYVDWHVGTRQQCETQRKNYSKRDQIQSKTQVKPRQFPDNTDTKKYGQSTIFKYDSQSQAPKKGELSLLLQKSNFHFFKFKTLDGPLSKN